MPERSFGRTVRYRRTKLGLSQAKLGELVGRAATTIRSWERDTTHPNDPQVISALAAILAIDEQMLFEKAGIDMPAHEASPTMEEYLATLRPADVPSKDEAGDAQRTDEGSLPETDPVQSPPDQASESGMQEETSNPPVVRAGYVAPPDPFVRTAPSPTVGELSYVEDQGQRQIYRVRTMATLVGIVVLAIALIWAIGQSLGALGDWWDSFFGNLRL